MSVTQPPLRDGASFVDARSCREWLGSLLGPGDALERVE